MGSGVSVAVTNGRPGTLMSLACALNASRRIGTNREGNNDI